MFSWLTEWKEKQLGKVSNRQNPGESFLFKLLKKRKTWFKQLLEFTIELFTFNHCSEVRWAITM